MTIVRTTFQAPQLLLYRLKVQAAKEQTDVSRLLCKIAAAYLDREEKRSPTLVAQIVKHRHEIPSLLEKLKVAEKQVAEQTIKASKVAKG
jgi:hypothetical protein